VNNSYGKVKDADGRRRHACLPGGHPRITSAPRPRLLRPSPDRSSRAIAMPA